MKQAALQAEIITPNLEYGEVLAAADMKRIQVSTPFGTVKAHKAVSCLVSPVAGDRVLLSTDMTGSCYILSVLERTMTGEMELALEGNAKLSTNNGSLTITAGRNVSLSSVESIDIATGRVSMSADRGEASIRKFSFLGSSLYTQVKRFAAVARTVEHTFKRFTQRFENCERYVEDHEEIQTGSTRYLVGDTMTTHAKNTMNVSEELHTMQAEQIHMG